jgi:hypothetical protein
MADEKSRPPLFGTPKVPPPLVQHPTHPGADRGLEKPADPKFTEVQKERAELLVKIQDTLHRFGDLESNVPITDPYWDYLNQLRGLK